MGFSGTASRRLVPFSESSAEFVLYGISRSIRNVGQRQVCRASLDCDVAPQDVDCVELRELCPDIWIRRRLNYVQAHSPAA